MKVTIGREDKADFPEFSLENIDVKIDSGAFTSSIHCSDIIEFVENDKKLIKFTLLDPEHSLYNNKEFVSEDYDVKIVKSSNGIADKRYMILTEILIFDETYPIYLTLSERKEMKFPILLGRKFLNKKFVIDTVKKNLSFKLKNTKNK